METPIGGDMRVDALSCPPCGALLHDGKDFNYVELLLQLCCRTSRIRLLHAWRLVSPQVAHDFQRRTKDRLVVGAFLDARTLEEENSLQDIIRRGIKIPPSGLRIATGNFSLPGFPLLKETSMSSSGATDVLHLHPLDPTKRETLHQQVQEAGRDMLTGERRLFEFLLCDVGVGRSLVLETAGDAARGGFSLPCEFDSVYVEKPADPAPEESVTVHYCDIKDLPAAATAVIEEEARESKGGGGEREEGRGEGMEQQHEKQSLLHKTVLGAPMGAPIVSNTTINNNNNDDEEKVLAPGVLPQYTFRHEYVIYDSSQILPKYFIVFEMDPCSKELFSLPLCDNCRERPACIWCASDAARLCISCDRGIHGQNRLVSRHIRVPLNEMPRRPGRCSMHSAAQYKWFCTCCDRPVCRFCLPSHQHADATLLDGNKQEQPLLPLIEPYRAALQLAKQPHYLLQARRNELRKRLEALQTILTDVRGNFREVEERCFALLEKAMTSLQRQTEEKMAVVAARQRELQRQLDFFGWGEAFLDYQRRVLPPADLLAGWLRHCRLREELRKLSMESSDAAARPVFADLRLQGHVCILTDSAVRRRKAAHMRVEKKALGTP